MLKSNSKMCSQTGGWEAARELGAGRESGEGGWLWEYLLEGLLAFSLSAWQSSGVMMAQDFFLAWNTGGETEERQLRHLSVGMMMMEGRGEEMMKILVSSVGDRKGHIVPSGTLAASALLNLQKWFFHIPLSGLEVPIRG